EPSPATATAATIRRIFLPRVIVPERSRDAQDNPRARRRAAARRGGLARGAAGPVARRPRAAPQLDEGGHRRDAAADREGDDDLDRGPGEIDDGDRDVQVGKGE